MLILAGAVLVLSFLLAAFSVTELAAQETALGQDPEGQLAGTFQETRGEIAIALNNLVIPQTDNATLLGYFTAQKAEFEERGRAHGVFTILGLSSGGSTAGATADPVAPRAEKKDFTNGGASAVCGTANYNAWSYNGTRNYAGVKWDCGDDGILFDAGTGRITGLALYLFMASEGARVDESFVLALN